MNISTKHNLETRSSAKHSITCQQWWTEVLPNTCDGTQGWGRITRHHKDKKKRVCFGRETIGLTPFEVVISTTTRWNRRAARKS